MIGIFDSGIGGLTVVREIFKVLPQYKIIYFGDTARLPYGTKSKDTIQKFALQDTKFLIKKGAKIIIIACHTASSMAGDYLRQKFPKIPFFDVVFPGVEEAAKVSQNKKIGIIGTSSTIKSQVHAGLLKKIDPKIEVIAQACPLLIPLVEEGWFSRLETRRIIRYYLRPLKLKRIDTLILACTHFPLLEKTIFEILRKKVKIIDPAKFVAQNLKEYLKLHPKIEKTLFKNKSEHEFYFSDIPYHFEQFSKKILAKSIKLKKVYLE